MEEMPGSGPIKTSAEADAEELPSCLKELTVNLNDALAAKFEDVGVSNPYTSVNMVDFQKDNACYVCSGEPFQA